MRNPDIFSALSRSNYDSFKHLSDEDKENQQANNIDMKKINTEINEI
jgi:hypothetical protein